MLNVENKTKAAISVIVCAYTESRWNEMLSAVESLRHQTLTPHEIILVIDHHAKLFERTRTQLPDVTVIENQEQRGLSGARNSGLAVATGEIVAFMDEDAVAEPDWLAQLADCYDDPQVMGAGGAIEPLWQSGRPRWFPEEFDWVVGCTYRGMPTTRAQVRNLIGCNMSFRRSVYERIGGFRDGIGRIGTRPLGCEETEFCIRANQRFPEPRFVYEPAARVRHHVPDSRGNWSYFRSRCYAEGLSKALISRLVGASSGLSSEKTYVIRTLPLGVLRGLANTLRFDLGGIGRAGAIVSGLFLTGIGYLVGSVSLTLNARRTTVPAAKRTVNEPVLGEEIR